MPIVTEDKRRDSLGLFGLQRLMRLPGLNNISYSKFMNYLHKSDLEIDRKILADIVANNPEKFSNIVKSVLPS